MFQITREPFDPPSLTEAREGGFPPVSDAHTQPFTGRTETVDTMLSSSGQELQQQQRRPLKHSPNDEQEVHYDDDKYHKPNNAPFFPYASIVSAMSHAPPPRSLSPQPQSYQPVPTKYTDSQGSIMLTPVSANRQTDDYKDDSDNDDVDEDNLQTNESKKRNTEFASTAPSDTPRTVTCPNCRNLVTTVVEFQPSPLSYILAFIIFLFFGWIAFCILPFLWPLLQIAVHTCPLCFDTVTRQSRLACFKLKEEIVTIRIGTCAVVLSKRYVIALFCMLLLICTAVGLRWYVKNVGIPDIPKGPLIDTPWETFLRNCGSHSYLGNALKAEAVFKEVFYLNTVIWTGRMHHIQEGILAKHFMFLDMIPPQYIRPDQRDIALLFGKSLQSKVELVGAGDEVRFEATLIELGKRGFPHLGVLWDVNVTAKKEDLPPIEFPPLSRFFRLKERLGPVDLPRVVHQLSKAHQMLVERQHNITQGDEDDFVVLSLGDGSNDPVRVARNKVAMRQIAKPHSINLPITVHLMDLSSKNGVLENENDQ